MTPRQAWQSVPRWLQVLAGVGGIVMALLLFGDRWVGLPAQVEAHEAAIDEVQRAVEGQGRAIQAMGRDVSFVRCWIIQPDSADARERLERCEP